MRNYIISAENIVFSYDKKEKRPFINKLNLYINKGEFISIVGENGSGKSTLFLILNGILKPISGNILYKGKNIIDIPLIKRAKKIASVYQNDECNFPFTCFEIVSMGLYPQKGYFYSLDENDIKFIEHIMDKMGILKFSDRYITDISGGERQRVLIAKALVQKPEILFLDEAMSSLDISSKIHITNILHDFVHNYGMTVISIQHDLQLAFDKSDKIIAMKNGSIKFFNSPCNLINNEFFVNIFGIKAEIYDNKKFFIS